MLQSNTSGFLVVLEFHFWDSGICSSSVWELSLSSADICTFVLNQIPKISGLKYSRML